MQNRRTYALYALLGVLFAGVVHLCARVAYNLMLRESRSLDCTDVWLDQSKTYSQILGTLQTDNCAQYHFNGWLGLPGATWGDIVVSHCIGLVFASIMCASVAAAVVAIMALVENIEDRIRRRVYRATRSFERQNVMQ